MGNHWGNGCKGMPAQTVGHIRAGNCDAEAGTCIASGPTLVVLLAAAVMAVTERRFEDPDRTARVCFWTI